MRRSSLNRHSPLPRIKSAAQDPKPTKHDQCDGITESKPRQTTAARTGPTTNAYKLRDLPLEEVVAEVETRMNRLKKFDKFSNSDCSDDLLYLNAATRCGSNSEVTCVAITAYRLQLIQCY